MILDFILKPTVPSGQPVLQDEASQLGSKLFQQDNWSDDPVVNKRRQIGVLVAVPQVPPFMTEHFPEVAEVTDGNPLVLSDLCQEWFERIVWIPNDKLNQVVASSDQPALAQVAQMESIRQLLASPFSLGCSPASPAVRLYQALPGPGGLALQKSVEVFQCIVDSNVTGTKIIDSMTVVSLGPVGGTVMGDPAAFRATTTAFARLPRQIALKANQPVRPPALVALLAKLQAAIKKMA